MPETETWNTRVLPPMKYGRPWRQPCLGPNCDNVLLIECLTEGSMWACARCHKIMEFYTAYKSGPGGSIKYVMVRLLLGEHIRTQGEPSITEFIDE